MEGQLTIGHFETSLPEEVLGDLLTPGKVFRKEIWQKGVDENAGLNSCLVLDKVADSIVKILVTVYGPEKPVVPTDSDKKPEASESKPKDVQPTTEPEKVDPPPSKSFQDSCIQTESAVLQDGVMQTEEKQLESFGAQTVQKAFADLEMQTENPMQTVDVQTDNPVLKETDMQTIIKEFSECEVQTIIKEFAEIDAQTEGGRSTEFVQSQTDISLFLQQEQACQTFIETHSQDIQTELLCDEKEIQTERNEGDACVQTDNDISQNETQTDMSMANQSESFTQVEIELAEAENQTDNDIREQLSQTDKSMAWESEQFCQAVTDTTPNDSQTEDIESFSQTSQTEVASESKDSQTVLDQDDRESQTIVDQGDQGTQAVVDQSTQGSQMSEEQECVPVEEQPIPVPEFDASQSAESASEFSSPEKRPHLEEIKLNMCDGFAQTDPVTIIIGDASFLVKKLKSTTMPSRVTSSGNEIEIELKDDSHIPSEPQRLEPGEILYKQGGEKENVIIKREPYQYTRGRGGVRQRGGIATRGGRSSLPATPGGSPYTPQGRQISPAQAAFSASPKLPPRTNPRGRINPSPRKTPPGPKIIQPAETGVHARGYDPQGRYSCPFCTLAFVDSPALYEHLQLMHGEECGKIKKPKGREGKTIIPRPRAYSPEQLLEGPPVLIPQQPFGIEEVETEPGREPGEVLYREVESEPGEVIYKVQEIPVRPDKEDGEIDYRVDIVHQVEGEAIQQEEEVSVEPIVHGKGRSQIEAEIAEKAAQLSEEADTEGELEEVVDEDAGDENYSCEVCPKRFQRSAGLFAHVQNDHGVDQEEATHMSSAPEDEGEEVAEEQEEAEEEAVEEEGEIEEEPGALGKRKRTSSGGTPTKRRRQSSEGTEEVVQSRTTRRSIQKPQSDTSPSPKPVHRGRGRPRKN